MEAERTDGRVNRERDRLRRWATGKECRDREKERRDKEVEKFSRFFRGLSAS
jgi:hypothetical protein